MKGAAGGGNRPFYIAIGVLLVGGIATLSYMAMQPAQLTRIDSSIAPIPNQGHALGSDSAVAEVIEFGDFECPACGSFANLTEPDVRARLVQTGLIRFRYMDFPLSGHQNTWPAHLASWCAGEQGKFWEMHDAIFMNQDRWNGQATRRPERVLADLARQVGVGMEQYQTCMSSSKYAPQIRANVAEGARLGVGGTPTFLFGRTLDHRVLNYDQFKAMTDTLVALARAERARSRKGK